MTHKEGGLWDCEELRHTEGGCGTVSCHKEGGCGTVRWYSHGPCWVGQGALACRWHPVTPQSHHKV